MPALKRAKYEAIVQAIARGVKPTDSYISQGYSKNGAGPAVGKLLRSPKIRARLDEIRAELEAAETHRIVTGEVQTGLEVAISSRNEQVRQKGHRYNDLLRIKQEQAAYFQTDNPYVLQMRQMFGAKGLPGVDTGYVKLRIRGIAGKAVPHLELDTALLREMASLEDQVGRLMGFVTPIMAQQVGDVNNVNIVVMQCAADLEGED